MSPVPSPAPAPANPQPTPAVSARNKQKPIPHGIAAGAEDAKYHTKYKELKVKVKDIEADNDKLHFKVLQAKLSIRRMKMERAILYERLSSIPPSPPPSDRVALPHIPSAAPTPAPSSRPAPPPLDQDMHIPDHMRPPSVQRVPSATDTRPQSALENSHGPSVAPSVHSPHRMSSNHDSRYPPSAALPPVHSYENSRSHSHASPSMHHAHPPSHSHSRNRSHSSSRSRSQQVPTQPYRTGTGHGVSSYPESIAAAQQPLHSPPLSDRERSRRTDYHDYPPSHGDPHSYDRHHIPVSPPRSHNTDSRASTRLHNHQRLGPASYVNRDDPYDRQRELERDRDWEFRERERERDRDRERERERERDRERARDYSRPSRDMISPNMHSPHSIPRSRPLERDYDHHIPSSRRGEDAYYADMNAPMAYAPHLSRADTPASGSGSGSGIGLSEEPSRPDSRTQHYYDRERERDRDHSGRTSVAGAGGGGGGSYRLRANEEVQEHFAHDDGRGVREMSRSSSSYGAVERGLGPPMGSSHHHLRHSPPPPPGGAGSGPSYAALAEPSRPLVVESSRKRGRNDMEVDSDNDVGREGSPAYAMRMPQDDRSSKRYHRSAVDSNDDGRMPPS